MRILRDKWGVPHVFGKTDADVAFGLAYAHAEDDFETISEALLSGRGELAASGDIKGIPVDYLVHVLRIWDTVHAKYETDLSPETRAICEAYAAGLNYYAALHPGEVTADLIPARGEDVVAGFVLKAPLFFGLPTKVLDLLVPWGKRGGAEKVADAAVRTVYTSGQELASNTFAVGPSRSADGATRLNINSHQPWDGQVAWYEAHLHSEDGWDCVGGLFPGTPVVLHGHNRDLGWAHTVNSPDLVDIYALTLNSDNPGQYLFDGEWHDLEARNAEITVQLWGPLRWPFKFRCWWSKHHGPVVKRGRRAYAIRYGGMGEVRQVEQWYRMNKARNLVEFQDALRMRAMASFNVGYADREGNIYYLYNGAIPVRAEGYDWKHDLPGDTSETVWTEYVPFEQLPQVLNPSSGFIQNCNNTPFKTTVGPDNPRPEDFPPACGIQTNMTNRAWRALELLGGDESITEEEFYAYKFDTKYSDKSKVVKAVKKVTTLSPPDEDPLVHEAIELIKRWDLSTDPDNTSAAIAVTALKPLLGPGVADLDEAEVLKRLRKAARELHAAHGRLDVPWQEVNRLRRGPVDVGLGGGPDVLRAIYGVPSLGRLRGAGGDSYIMIVAWDKDGKVSSRSIHQYGSATRRKSSPHYADQAPLFAQRKLKPVWLDEADIRANLEREYRPGDEVAR